MLGRIVLLKKDGEKFMASQQNESIFRATWVSIKKHPYISIMLTAAIIVLVVFAFIISSIMAFASYSPTITEYANIADYGKYDGTSKDEFVSDYIQSFFPKTIDASFSNVSYSYKAVSGSTYSFETYLEFTIEDTDAFNEYVTSIANKECWKKFEFDNRYMECCIEDAFLIGENSEKTAPDYRIALAKIRKVLYSSDTQTIIFVAIGVYDGSTNVEHLNTFFERFDINPADYAKTAQITEEIDPYSI